MRKGARLSDHKALATGLAEEEKRETQVRFSKLSSTFLLCTNCANRFRGGRSGAVYNPRRVFCFCRKRRKEGQTSKFLGIFSTLNKF